MIENDDTASNPKAEGHLPVAGEFDAENIPQGNPLTTDRDDLDAEDIDADAQS